MTERNPILQSLFDRKSVRVYEEKPIPAEMKQAILEAAAQAPSAGCQQLYTILDITDPVVEFHAYLSPSKKFDTLDELRACINNAAKRAQEYFGEAPQ